MKKQQDNALHLLDEPKQDNGKTTPPLQNKTTLYICCESQNDTTPQSQNKTGTKNVSLMPEKMLRTKSPMFKV